MKLIKLSSTTSGEFENVFDVDIPINPKAEVGLVSASVVLSSKNITIDDTNNLFEMRTQQTQGSPATPRLYYPVNLTNGDYTKPSFLTELNRALNAALNNDTESTACVEWRTGVNDGKLQLEMRRGAFEVDVEEDDLSVFKNLTYAADTYTKSSASENWDAFGVSKSVFVNGCGEIAMIVDATTTKFALGLVANPPSSTATTLDASGYDFVVYTETGNPNYLISSASGVVDSGVAQEDDDTVIIELSEGNLILRKLQGLVFTTLHTFTDWSFQTYYHLGFNVRSTAGVVDVPSWAPSPYSESVDGVHIYRNTPIQDTILFDSQLLTTPPSRGIASITFKEKPATGTYMGFHDAEYAMATAGLNWTLVADEELSESVSFTDLLVELPNLTMESYDGGTGFGKRRPVVAYLPSLEVQNSEFVYNAINPVMIDLNNAFKFNLNRVQVRLLTSSPQIVKIESATIVILIG